MGWAVLGKSFSVVGFASGSNFKCVGFFPRGVFLVLVVWALSFKGLVQRIFSGCFLLWICFAGQWSIPALFRSSGVLLLLVWPNLLFQLFLPRGQTFARVGFCSSSYQTYLCGWSSGYKQVLQECWIFGTVCLFRWISGGVDFLGSFPKVGALSLSLERVCGLFYWSILVLRWVCGC